MNKSSRLRREQDILERLENVKRLIQMEFTLMTCEGCGLYKGYKNYQRKDGVAFGNNLLDDLRDEIQLQLLSITALCYGDNPDLGEPMPMLEWNMDIKGDTHPTDKFREVFDEVLRWNA